MFAKIKKSLVFLSSSYIKLIFFYFPINPLNYYILHDPVMRMTIKQIISLEQFFFRVPISSEVVESKF